ncbi:bacillithiol biosynthesis deacetylase BshB1 [Alteribacillus sp. YIM 98480]|uniref:bacillithiol biosynthesis deacetylase BshB1 n=1 Tax=Alteribacillus sp. YIM 98480 TaxID=2606599 RepID=UPI0021033087|nr:bacillithiol biosynthesis deacetylase BshB1 [Alteribacillus sp. YIM 98480]
MLAVGAHPDDIEIGMGGTAASHSNKGDDVYICNLTKGELSSNGTIEERQHEAEKAAGILGIKKRFQLDFSDRSLDRSDSEYSHLITLIRELKPGVIFAPYHEDRHPDHGACCQLVKEAVFDAGIRKFPGSELEPHKTPSLFYYFINGFSVPDFFIDISSTQKVKEDALSSYQSQFVKRAKSVSTPLTDRYIESVKSRDSLFGKEAGVTFAEGFKTGSPLVFSAIPQRSSL